MENLNNRISDFINHWNNTNQIEQNINSKDYDIWYWDISRKLESYLSSLMNGMDNIIKDKGQPLFINDDINNNSIWWEWRKIDLYMRTNDEKLENAYKFLYKNNFDTLCITQYNKLLKIKTLFKQFKKPNPNFTINMMLK